MGSRYGGLKQLEKVGPGGNTLMDYSIYDAARAGFDRVVFVIRPELLDTFQSTLAARYRSRLRVTFALQHTALASGPVRTRPWGTAHAVLASAPRLTGPFAVLNADDFYGRPAIEACATYLASPAASDADFAVVGYRLADTASESGGVTRGLLHYDAALRLESVVETRDLQLRSDGRFEGESAAGKVVCDAGQLVSMNLWAFRPAILRLIGEEFNRFVVQNTDPNGELQLAEVVERLLRGKGAMGRVLAPGSPWCGLTFAEDRDRVRAKLAAMVASGDYPEVLLE